jgi:Xaa-Pro dipeptidase
MALQFSREEYASRIAAAQARMAEEGLDGLILFRQESMYYLTGYDSDGWVMFQAMYLGADGRPSLLIRSADRVQSRITSIVEDIREWADREGASPADDLRDMLDGQGCRGRRIGIEYHAYGLTAQRGRMVDAALDGFCELVDASDLVRLQRLVKSPAELDYVREAGALADAARDVANRMCVPGEALGAVYGAMVETIMAGGGDPSAARWPVGVGEEAMLVRYHTGLGHIGVTDQVQLEFAGTYRHYHAAVQYVVLTGRVDARHRAMFDACRDALDACHAALVPGKTVGGVFDAHAAAFAEAGFGDAALNACGYTQGATYFPTWMDWPMIYTGNPQVLAPGMVFFMHMVLLDRETGLAMSLGETAIVTEGVCEPVNHAPRALVVND